MQTPPRNHPRHAGTRALVVGLLALLAAGALASQTVGCVATAETMPTRGVVVSGPPPAPLNEARPDPPKSRAAWVGGYWHWTGMQYAWIPGHWDRAPQGSQWIGPRYFQQGGQYRYEAGSWAGSRAALR